MRLKVFSPKLKQTNPYCWADRDFAPVFQPPSRPKLYFTLRHGLDGITYVGVGTHDRPNQFEFMEVDKEGIRLNSVFTKSSNLSTLAVQDLPLSMDGNFIVDADTDPWGDI